MAYRRQLIKLSLLFLICIFSTASVYALSPLQQYFKLKSSGQSKNAKKALDKWTPKGFEQESYKKYFIAVHENSSEKYWQLYQDLAAKKKLIKLQHQSIKRVIEIDIDSKTDTVKNFKNFSHIAKGMLSVLTAQPEGIEYELDYLKWILKNRNLKEFCVTERSRWLSQQSLNLKEVMQGLETCPLTYKDFIYRIRMLVFSGEEAKAQGEISEYADKTKLADWEKAYLQAVFYSNVGDPTSAFKIIIPFEAELKKSEDYYDNLFYISQRAGELSKAEEIINIIIETTKEPKLKKDFIFQKAFLFYQTQRYKEAISILNPLIKAQLASSKNKKYKSKDFDDLFWLRAWCYYLNKDYEKAREAFTESKDWTRDKARNLYWLAQTEWALDDAVAAVVHFRQLALPVIEGKFFSYYNYLAWLRFEAYKSFANSELLRSEMLNLKSGRGLYAMPDFSISPVQLLSEYQSYFEDVGSSDEGSIEAINQDELAAPAGDIVGIKTNTSAELKSELSWADDLLKWGYRDLAKWHLYEVEKTLKTKDEAEPLIQYYLDNEYYNRALVLANSVISPSGKKLNLKEEPLLWKALFPKAYDASVQAEAKKREVSPYLIWSIMKAETQYKYDAVSPVGAFGLMQFMPYTSQKVAVLLNEENKVDQLFEPEVAIKFGATYLKKLSDELGGQLPLIAAAYNGGPHRAKLWMKNFKQPDNSNMEFDMFIEHIPFNETRTYVKRVLSYYLSYQKLYEEKLDYRSSKWLIEKNSFKLKEPISLKEEWPKVPGT
jgi:soluble lytic murein transglycosylase